MRSKVYLICFTGLLLLGFSNPCYAQLLPEEEMQDTVKTRSVMPMSTQSSSIELMTPSPKASAMMRYGEYPVSLHTGLVDITIPIYTIERCGVTVPIEFKYHASGIKYDDVSMEVGLGWTLNAGGVITESVRGSRDGRYNPGTTDVNKINICNRYLTLSDGYGLLQAIERGDNDDRRTGSLCLDGEVDIFSYSFLNKSGRFCFPLHDSHMDENSRLANVHQGVFIPVNGMKTKGKPYGTDPIVLIDTDGVSYTFEKKDSHQNKHYQEYYLTKILAAGKTDEITFHYDTYNPRGDLSKPTIHRPYINYRYTTTLEKQQIHPWGDGHPGFTAWDFKEHEFGGMYTQLLAPPRLSRINFRGGYIIFEYHSTDIWNLQRVKIYNNTHSSPIQTISLKKSKFKNREDRLNEVVFDDSKGSSYNYQFDYYGEPGNMDRGNEHYKGTLSGIDYWGYFNGKMVDYNKRFTPNFIINKTGASGATHPYEMYGMDRRPSEHYMKGGILNKIVYPTKGYTLFEYEPHWADIGGRVNMLGGLRIKEIRNYLPDGSLAEKKWYKYGDNETGFGSANSFPEAPDFRVDKLKIRTRIKEDGGTSYGIYSGTEINTYSAFSKRDHWILGSTVVYNVITEYVGDDSVDFGKTVYRYIVVLDVPIPREKNLEAEKPSGEWFKTYRWYSPDRYERTYSWKTGKLSSKKIFKKSDGYYKSIYSLANYYEDINEAEFRNLRVLPYVSHTPYDSTDIDLLRDGIHCGFSRNWVGACSPYNYFNYYITTGQRVLTSSLEEIDGAYKITKYQYNEYGFPKSVNEEYNDGNNILTINLYPTDSQYASSSVYKAMIGDAVNIISPVLNQVVYQTNESVSNNYVSISSVSYTNTNSPNSSLYVPSSQSTSYPMHVSPASRGTQYHKYDKYGNILYLTQDQLTKVVYLWSYNALHPVIKIQNATYQEVESILGASAILALSSNPNPSDTLINNYSDMLRTRLTNTLVTLQTYTPLIGVKAIGDPSGRKAYYSYDNFGRLTSIHDDNEKLVEGYQYHYSN